MPHSPNLRYIKNGTQGIHLNSKGAKKFDEARATAISSQRGTSTGRLVRPAKLPPQPKDNLKIQ